MGRQNGSFWTRFTLLGWSLVLAAVMPAWVASCSSTGASAGDAGSGGAAGAGLGGAAGAGLGGAGPAGGMEGSCPGYVDAATDRADIDVGIGDGLGALDTDAAGQCPILNDPLSPPSTVVCSSFVGGRGVILVPVFMIAFDTTFRWTATDGPGQTGAGTFDNPTAASTTFRCTQAGPLTITVHLGLPNTACDMPTSWAVTCQL